MQAYEPKKDKKPTKYVGGAGHWARRGSKKPKGKK